MDIQILGAEVVDRFEEELCFVVSTIGIFADRIDIHAKPDIDACQRKSLGEPACPTEKIYCGYICRKF